MSTAPRIFNILLAIGTAWITGRVIVGWWMAPEAPWFVYVMAFWFGLTMTFTCIRDAIRGGE